MARKPYIDTRLSFASFTPAGLKEKTREKLVNYYLTKLSQNKLLHDKIEFSIAYTCFDLTLPDNIDNCGALNKVEKEELLNSLKRLTNELILNYKSAINKDYELLDRLDNQLAVTNKSYENSVHYWENFSAANLLFSHTRTLGVFPFAKLARLAFIGHSLLDSLVTANLISKKRKRNVSRFHTHNSH